MDISELLQIVVDEGASDLHLTVGIPPFMRVHGRLVPINVDPLEASDTDNYVRGLSSDETIEKVRQQGGTDFGFSFGDSARFRVSIYRQRGVHGLALRQIPTSLYTLEEIGFSGKIKNLLDAPRGLILVTGPTGSGKTTTLACMVDTINNEKDRHIITIEDPIEYYHKHKKSIITQREVGVDVSTFAEAVKRSLRMDPDVVLVGEMRDLATMEAAITAAETGHLVFATLHTTGAAETVDRIIDSFPTNQQEQIRAQLSSAILAVISQVLLPKADGPGRVAAFEVMVNTPSVQNLIRDHKTFRITSDIQTGGKFGMQTMDSHLWELYTRNLISYESVIAKSYDEEAIKDKIAGSTKKKKWL